MSEKVTSALNHFLKVKYESFRDERTNMHLMMWYEIADSFGFPRGRRKELTDRADEVRGRVHDRVVTCAWGVW